MSAEVTLSDISEFLGSILKVLPFTRVTFVMLIGAVLSADELLPVVLELLELLELDEELLELLDELSSFLTVTFTISF